jgi:hypothetical protein
VRRTANARMNERRGRPTVLCVGSGGEKTRMGRESCLGRESCWRERKTVGPMVDAALLTYAGRHSFKIVYEPSDPR